ncbi:Calcineurin-like phosphoesterase domain-containing protein [Pararobbsia alpina]
MPGTRRTPFRLIDWARIGRRGWLIASIGSCALFALAPLDTASAASGAFSFAVIGNGPFGSAEEPAARRLLDAIGHASEAPRFIVDTGNIKAPGESCDDTLLLARQGWLDSSPVPLFYVPGENEWIACQFGPNGGNDPRERLDFIREHFFDDDQSFGVNKLPLSRQSASARFRLYRENMRWQSGDVVFVTLNVPGDNNHYLNEGGRNGEFEERDVANREWLDRTETVARHGHARAIVIAIEGDPQFEAGARRDRLFGWLRFDRQSARDGYAELKQALLKLTQRFEGPVLLIDGGVGPLATGYRIDEPLRDEHGTRVPNFARLEISGSPHLSQWIRVRVEPDRKEVFRIRVEKVAALPPDAAPAPVQPEASAPTGVEAPKMLPLPPVDRAPGE